MQTSRKKEVSVLKTSRRMAIALLAASIVTVGMMAVVIIPALLAISGASTTSLFQNAYAQQPSLSSNPLLPQKAAEELSDAESGISLTPPPLAQQLGSPLILFRPPPAFAG